MFENTRISNFMKIHLVGAELFHASRRADRQTNRQNDEANTLFSQFCERAQKLTEFHLVSYSLIN